MAPDDNVTRGMRIRGLSSGMALVTAVLSHPSPFATRCAGAQDVARVSLAEAVSRALAQNPSAAVAYAQVERARAVVEETRSNSLPTLVGNGTLTFLDSPRQAAGAVVQPQTGVLASALLTVPIVTPKPWVQWSQAKDQFEVSRASASDVRRLVATAVARAYLAIVAQKRVIEAATRARDTDKAHYDFAHKRYVGGVGNRIDEVRSEQQLESDEANVQQQWSLLARQREALGVLVGAYGPLDAEEVNLQVDMDPDRALADAERRSDVVAGAARMRASDHLVRQSWTDYSPYLTGTFMPFYANPATVNYPTTGWQAQLVLTIPFYDGGLRYGQKRERTAAEEEARVQLEATLRQAKAEVRTAFEEIRRADATLEAARKAADLARQGLELAQIAYRGGTTTNLEVIDAERTARDAETAVAVAEDGARQARLDMLSSTGRFP
jgi:outer membrane protein TolC